MVAGQRHTPHSLSAYKTHTKYGHPNHVVATVTNERQGQSLNMTLLGYLQFESCAVFTELADYDKGKKSAILASWTMLGLMGL